MLTLTFISMLLSFGIGASVLWTNYTRFTNQIFALFSLVTSTWLFFIFQALFFGASGDNPVPWLRAASAAGAFIPWIIWLLMNAITTQGHHPKIVILRSWPWFFVAVILAVLCSTYFFIPANSTPDYPKRGIGYLLYNVTSVCLYGILVARSYWQMRHASGIRKIELQFLTFNGGLGCIATVALTAIGSYLDMRTISRLSPLVILVFYMLTVWGVTIHRVFDARQVFLTIAQRLGTMTVLVLGTFTGQQLFSETVPAPGDLILSLAICSSIAFWLERKSLEWLNLSPWQNTAATRQAALEIARREPDPNKVVSEFESLLCTWCQTDNAVLLFDNGEAYIAGDIEFSKDRSGFPALTKEGWSTPESLQRLRPERGLVDLRQFLSEFTLGLVVIAPRDSRLPSLLMALGVKTNHRPFTYPEVQQVQEVAEFMDNILARSRLSMKARQSEQLATIGLIGASLAHEIRNPLVSIKTFSHLLLQRFDDPEFRQRFSQLIPAEVDRIDSLTQQLLDLSNPRRHQLVHVALHAIVKETADLMFTRAVEANVILTTHLTATADDIFADAGAIRQVLINLLINAFQALENKEGERRVQIRSRNTPGGSIVLEVADNGPGIPVEQRTKLFHPFVSTKTKGMGLGLAICSDILHEHRATIIVPDLGRPGAIFRITFPCPPPSS